MLIGNNFSASTTPDLGDSIPSNSSQQQISCRRQSPQGRMAPLVIKGSLITRKLNSAYRRKDLFTRGTSTTQQRPFLQALETEVSRPILIYPALESTMTRVSCYLQMFTSVSITGDRRSRPTSVLQGNLAFALAMCHVIDAFGKGYKHPPSCWTALCCISGDHTTRGS